MEVRLAARLGPGLVPEKTAIPTETSVSPNDNDAVVAAESINVWPDEAAETMFMADARTRGEPAEISAGAATEAAEETDTRGLPPLDGLVQRIPAEVREALDDLFRAKFTAVRRVPRKALKE